MHPVSLVSLNGRLLIPVLCLLALGIDGKSIRSFLAYRSMIEEQRQKQPDTVGLIRMICGGNKSEAIVLFVLVERLILLFTHFGCHSVAHRGCQGGGNHRIAQPVVYCRSLALVSKGGLNQIAVKCRPTLHCRFAEELVQVVR